MIHKVGVGGLVGAALIYILPYLLCPPPSREPQKHVKISKQLRATAGRLLYVEAVRQSQERAAYLPDVRYRSRLFTCERRAIPGKKLIAKRSKWGGEYLINVKTCEHPYCPVCAGRRARALRRDIEQAIEAHEQAGGLVVLGTFTIRDVDVALVEQAARWEIARAALHNSKPWRAMAARYGLTSSLRVTESTYMLKAHHFHMHDHVLLFVAGSVDVSKLHADLNGAWQRSCNSRGLEARSVDVTRADGGAGSYLTKQANMCCIKDDAKSCGPLQLLRHFHDTGDSEYAKLYVEFARSMKRDGKRDRAPVYWHGKQALKTALIHGA